MKTKLPDDTLTVIFRDDGPMVCAGDSPAFRSVKIKLTEEQRDALRLRGTYTSGNTEYYESISRCFIEQGETK